MTQTMPLAHDDRQRRLACMGALLLLAVAWDAPASAATPAEALGPAVIDVEARRQALQRPDHEPAREACLAADLDEPLEIPDPLPGLSATEDYGSDQGAEAFSWPVMVLAGRSLAGDDDSTRRLVDALVEWADAGALEDTPTHYDPFYAMKRMLLPTMVAFRIVAADMAPDQRDRVRAWLDGLVRRVDAVFDGDVDHNNHRYLADLVLMTWGSIVRDEALLARGAERFRIALAQARPDGSLPLETRRGARALWYSNMALGELALMAQVARLNGSDLLAGEDGEGFGRMLSYLADALATPALVLTYAAENHIPGPSADYRNLDLGFTETRGHGRHYMAWTELLTPPSGPAAQRIAVFRDARLSAARPLIDEYAGGNATCFWWQPGGG